MGASVDFSFNNGAPAGRDLGVPAITGVAPGAAGTGVPARTAGAPGGVAVPSFAANEDAPESADSGVPDRTDAVPAVVNAGNYTPSNAAPAAAATGTFTPDNDSARGQHARPDTLAKPFDPTVNTPILKAEGSLVQDQLFGWYKVADPSALKRIQLALEEPPVGGPATVALVKPDGSPWGITVTVAAGQQFGEAVIAPAHGFVAGDEIRAKPTLVGTEEPGGFGTLTMDMQLV